MRFKKSVLADEDIINIYLYTHRNFGLQQAGTCHAELHDAFTFLAENPLIAVERTEYKPPVRIHQHRQHMIVYLIEDDCILIIRVLHEKMDVKQRLLNNFPV